MHRITLPCSLQSDLAWSEIPLEDHTQFFLDFGWENRTPINLFSEVQFASHRLAIEEFTRRCPHATTVQLGKFSLPLALWIQRNETYERIAEEKMTDQTPFCEEILIAELLSEYLHRLAAPIGEDTDIILTFGTKDAISSAEQALLFCARRFEHFQVELPPGSSQISSKASLAVSLPQDAVYSPEKFSSIFTQLEARRMPYRCIPEELLNESWDQLEYLVVCPDTLGEIGMRMLYGFEAAGGTILSTGDLMGFEGEQSLTEFLHTKKSQRISGSKSE